MNKKEIEDKIDIIEKELNILREQRFKLTMEEEDKNKEKQVEEIYKLTDGDSVGHIWLYLEKTYPKKIAGILFRDLQGMNYKINDGFGNQEWWVINNAYEILFDKS